MDFYKQILKCLTFFYFWKFNFYFLNKKKIFKCIDFSKNKKGNKKDKK